MRGVMISLLVVLAGCGNIVSPKSHVTPARHVPVRQLALHGDTGFNLRERVWIDEALGLINGQTSGWVMVTVDYDLDFGDTGSIVRLRNDDMLIRAPVTADYVTKEDSNDALLLGTVHGISLSAYDSDASKRVYVVADRLTDRPTFIHVVEHEVYHALGLDHVDEASALMYAQTSSTVVPTTCLTLADAQELCRVIGCVTDDIAYCE